MIKPLMVQNKSQKYLFPPFLFLGLKFSPPLPTLFHQAAHGTLLHPFL